MFRCTALPILPGVTKATFGPSDAAAQRLGGHGAVDIRPVEEDGNIVFKEISKGDQIALDYLNSKTNPKDIFMPQAEVLCEFSHYSVGGPPPVSVLNAEPICSMV